MCKGKSKCQACRSNYNYNVAGRRKRRKRKYSTGMKKDKIVTALVFAGGGIVGSLIANASINNVGFLKKQPIIGGATALLASTMVENKKAKSFVSGIGAGMAIAGGTRALYGVAPEIMQKLNSISVGARTPFSDTNPGVAKRSMDRLRA